MKSKVKRVLIVLLMTGFGCLVPTNSNDNHIKFQNPSLGIEFRYPEGWDSPYNINRDYFMMIGFSNEYFNFLELPANLASALVITGFLNLKETDYLSNRETEIEFSEGAASLQRGYEELNGRPFIKLEKRLNDEDFRGKEMMYLYEDDHMTLELWVLINDDDPNLAENYKAIKAIMESIQLSTPAIDS